ncbi:MAG: asparagine synthase-related protein [Burkholderiaceae bacterium]
MAATSRSAATPFVIGRIAPGARLRGALPAPLHQHGLRCARQPLAGRRRGCAAAAPENDLRESGGGGRRGLLPRPGLAARRPARVAYGLRLRKALGGFTPRELVYPLYNGHRSHDAVARAQLADVHGYMTDDVLVKVDRMSMAHSLEVRSPLLDYRVLEFAATRPMAPLGDGRVAGAAPE